MNIIYTSNSEHLAKLIAHDLDVPCRKTYVEKFNCGELKVLIYPFNTEEVIIITQTSSNEAWIELFLTLNVLRNVKKIILCITYLGYSRQDKDIPFSSKADTLFLTFLETFKNIFYCIFVDCHNKPYIKIPMIHLSTQELFIQDIQKHYKNKGVIIVSPDKGRAHISNSIAKILGCTSINGEKIRDDNGKIVHISFNCNLDNKLCILCDDIIDTGKTLLFSADQLFKMGTKEIVTYATHAVFNEKTEKLLSQSNITRIVITDSIQKKLKYPNKFEKLSIVSLIVKTIQAIL